MAAVVHGVTYNNTANLSVYTTAAFTPATDDLLVVTAIVTGTVSVGSCSSSAGTTFTKVAPPTPQAGTYLFVANSRSTNTSQTISVDVTGDAGTGAIIHVARVSGMSRVGSSAVKQSGGVASGSAGTAPAFTFASSVLTEDPTIVTMVNTTSPAGLTPPTSWGELADSGYSTPTTGKEYASRNSGFTGTTVTWASNSATAWGASGVELDIQNTGALAVTLGAATLSATATIPVNGSLASTLGTLTSAGAGSVEVKGVLSQTLGAATLSATGTVAASGVTGDLDVTLETLALVSTGTIPINASLDKTLGTATLVSAGTIPINGELSKTFDLATLVSSGTIPINGLLSQTLGSISLSATGEVVTNGNLAITFDALSLAASGGAPVVELFDPIVLGRYGLLIVNHSII